MTPKQYLSLLELLEKEGFKVNRKSRILESSAEFYQWNQWTVQLCATGFDKVEELRIYTFFDSERLDYLNKTKVYPAERVVSAVCHIREEIERLKTGNLALMCEALQD